MKGRIDKNIPFTNKLNIYEFFVIINRPGVVGTVLKSPPSLIN